MDAASRDWHWPLAVVIIAVLLFAYCAYSARESSRGIDRALDGAADQAACYQAGYTAGLAGRSLSLPQGSEECGSWFELGFAEGARVYRAYGPLGD